jgi:hypothetical protein
MNKWLITISLFATPVVASDLVFQFKNPSFVNTGTEIVLTVTDTDGAITEIRIPVGTFGICSTDECGI